MAGEKAKQADKQQATTPDEAYRRFDNEIRLEAFGKYQWRCESHEPGSEADDWLAAEQIVLARHPVPAAEHEPVPSK